MLRPPRPWRQQVDQLYSLYFGGGGGAVVSNTFPRLGKRPKFKVMITVGCTNVCSPDVSVSVVCNWAGGCGLRDREIVVRFLEGEIDFLLLQSVEADVGLTQHSV